MVGSAISYRTRVYRLCREVEVSVGGMISGYYIRETVEGDGKG